MTFPDRSSGGYFVNGRESVVFDAATNTGFFAGGQSATFGRNFIIEYGIKLPRPIENFLDYGTGQISSLTNSIDTHVAISTPSVAPASILLTGTQPSELQRRNALGLEYALDNPVFKNELLNLSIKINATIQAGPLGGEVAGLLLKFKAAWQANEKVSKGNYLEALNDATKILLELFVETFGTPALAYPLAIAKISTAFATAYTYGFLWGQ